MSGESIGELAAGVRHHVYRSFVDRGHPPTLQEMADGAGAAAQDVVRALVHLEGNRALILSPARDRVIVAPPFSAIPTPFWVETGAGSWWGNCAWESLGIAALLNQDAVIRTSAGAQGRPLEIRTAGGAVPDSDTVMHIPVPAAQWWSDVRFTCSTILFFASRQEIDEWAARHDIPRGAVLDLQQAWSLAQDWFTGRLEPDWRPLPRPKPPRASIGPGCTAHSGACASATAAVSLGRPETGAPAHLSEPVVTKRHMLSRGVHRS